MLSACYAATGDVNVAQRRIVFIDETDNIEASGSKDIMLGIQHAFPKVARTHGRQVPP
jgi:ATP-dependent protease Clp ATPase subunit